MKLYRYLLILVPGLSWASDLLVGETEQGGWEKLNVSADLRMGYWSGSRNLDNSQDIFQAAIWLKSDLSLTHMGEFNVDAFYDTRHGGLDDDELNVREAYWRGYYGNFDFTLGRQILIWGRADRLNPTDNISSWDYTRLAMEETDQRNGVFIGRGTYYYGETSYSLIWLPEFVPNKLPGSTFSNDRKFDARSGSWAFKIDRMANTFDWSLSYLNYFQLNPSILLTPIPTNPGAIEEYYPEVEVYGGDLAATYWNTGFRAEFAYTDIKNNRESNGLYLEDNSYMVVGADKTWGEYLNINFQLFHRHVFDSQYLEISRDLAPSFYVSRNQLYMDTYGVSLRLANQWLNGNLRAEITTVHQWPKHGYAVKLKTKYSISDNWYVEAGTDYYRGNTNSYFGLLEKNKLLFAQVHYVF